MGYTGFRVAPYGDRQPQKLQQNIPEIIPLLMIGTKNLVLCPGVTLLFVPLLSGAMLLAEQWLPEPL